MTAGRLGHGAARHDYALHAHDLVRSHSCARMRTCARRAHGGHRAQHARFDRSGKEQRRPRPASPTTAAQPLKLQPLEIHSTSTSRTVVVASPFRARKRVATSARCPRGMRRHYDREIGLKREMHMHSIFLMSGRDACGAIITSLCAMLSPTTSTVRDQPSAAAGTSRSCWASTN